ncbi:hypothetical protein U5A82_14080 [Sphingobium sp. CR2-8]|uniref:hypothetical protein n=1 Tax=Sphingobium sp. CR2-8 TaxID=1306534 RepID=UPI002DBEA283|nr:hypothetical protein [Sphingobium sp. CR2-8]MEC3911551.1 hypothetical protein [Sphingobium sp. CR2-8]
MPDESRHDDASITQSPEKQSVTPPFELLGIPLPVIWSRWSRFVDTRLRRRVQASAEGERFAAALVLGLCISTLLWIAILAAVYWLFWG